MRGKENLKFKKPPEVIVYIFQMLFFLTLTMINEGKAFADLKTGSVCRGDDDFSLSMQM